MPAATPRDDRDRITIVLPAEERHEEAAVRRLTMRTLERVTGELAAAAPDRLVLIFHPTVESYQRASGRSWFTSATTIGRDIHFIPLSALRQQNSLDRTLTHELVHGVTAIDLAGRPAWIAEGLAVYFSMPADQRPASAPVAAGRASSCPADAELMRPASRATMGDAYRRAAACAAAAMAAKNWRAIED